VESILVLPDDLTFSSREPPASSQLATHLLVNQEDDRGVCHEFLTEFVSRFAEDDSAKEAMADAISDLSHELAKMSMNDDYKPYVLVSRLDFQATNMLDTDPVIGNAKPRTIPSYCRTPCSVIQFLATRNHRTHDRECDHSRAILSNIAVTRRYGNKLLLKPQD